MRRRMRKKKVQWWCVSDVAIHLMKSWKKKTIRCSDDVSIPSQYPWKRAEKRRCSPTSAPSMLDVSKDIQLVHNIHGNSADKTIVINSEGWTSSLLIMRLKDESKKRKKIIPQEWILCLLSEKEDKNPTRNEWIDVTTKSWNCLDEMGGHHYTSPFTMMKKGMTI